MIILALAKADASLLRRATQVYPITSAETSAATPKYPYGGGGSSRGRYMIQLSPNIDNLITKYKVARYDCYGP